MINPITRRCEFYETSPIWEVSTAALGVRNSSVEAMQDFGSLLRKQPAGLIVTLWVDEYSAPNRRLHFCRPCLMGLNVSVRDQQHRGARLLSPKRRLRFYDGGSWHRIGYQQGP